VLTCPRAVITRVDTMVFTRVTGLPVTVATRPGTVIVACLPGAVIVFVLVIVFTMVAPGLDTVDVLTISWSRPGRVTVVGLPAKVVTRV